MSSAVFTKPIKKPLVCLRVIFCSPKMDHVLSYHLHFDERQRALGFTIKSYLFVNP